MGMYSEPLFANKPDAVVDLKRLREYTKNAHGFGFLDPALLEITDDTITLGKFLLMCSGKLYAYMSGEMLMDWDIIAACTSEAASLYFHYEEGEIFRIDLDPTTQRRLVAVTEGPTYATTFGKNGKAMWFLTDPKKKPTATSSHTMQLRSGYGGAPYAQEKVVVVAEPAFHLPTKQEMHDRAFFHSPKVDLKKFYVADQRGQIAWERADTDNLNAWM
jgi:hypothetical protein